MENHPTPVCKRVYCYLHLFDKDVHKCREGIEASRREAQRKFYDPDNQNAKKRRRGGSRSESSAA